MRDAARTAQRAGCGARGAGCGASKFPLLPRFRTRVTMRAARDVHN
jgi:hypothetical protein